MNQKKTVNHSKFKKRLDAMQEKVLGYADQAQNEELLDAIQSLNMTANRLKSLYQLRLEAS